MSWGLAGFLVGGAGGSGTDAGTTGIGGIQGQDRTGNRRSLGSGRLSGPLGATGIMVRITLRGVRVFVGTGLQCFAGGQSGLLGSLLRRLRAAAG